MSRSSSTMIDAAVAQLRCRLGQEVTGPPPYLTEATRDTIGVSRVNPTSMKNRLRPRFSLFAHSSGLSASPSPLAARRHAPRQARWHRRTGVRST